MIIADLGRPGEVVTLEDKIARKLIICKSGLYATPENLESVTVKLADDAYSTKYVGTVSPNHGWFCVVIIRDGTSMPYAKWYSYCRQLGYWLAR